MPMFPAASPAVLAQNPLRDGAVGHVTLVNRGSVAPETARGVRPVDPGTSVPDLRLPRDLPAGPPPAFKVTILQRLREQQVQSDTGAVSGAAGSGAAMSPDAPAGALTAGLSAANADGAVSGGSTHAANRPADNGRDLTTLRFGLEPAAPYVFDLRV